MKMSNALIGLMIRAGIPMAFENEGNGGWKMDGDKPVFKDGNPVWVSKDGTESVLQRDTIERLNSESKTWRTRAEENMTQLKAYEGLDAAKAREALEKLQKIDQKSLIDAGEVDKVRNEIKSTYETQLNETKGTITKLQDRINGMITDSAFSASPYIRENIAVPVEMFRGAFGKFFKIENEQLQAFDAAGNRLMSKKKIGEYADFDEAVELLVESYPQKDAILKAPDQRGTNSNGNGGQRGGGRTLKRSDFEKLDAAKQYEFSVAVRKGEARLID
ncbi:hypothetical protein HUU40_00180 [candidate division KSB1 bacterium]|nr:hypothetical protein [candidate division KSB1 bacterium]